MILNFDRVMTDLEGATVNDETGKPIQLNKALANNLVNGSKGDTVKFYDWALTLYRHGSLTLDRADYNTLKSFVEGLDSVSILYRAQLLQCFVLSPE